MNMKDLRIRCKKRVEDIATELPVATSSVRAWERLSYAPRGTSLWMVRLMNVYQCTFEELVQAEKEYLKTKEK